MLALGLVMSFAAPFDFLDRDFHLWTAGLFLLLFAGEVRRMKVDRTPSESEPGQGRAEAGTPAGLCLGTAGGRRFLLPDDIVRAAAADDYSELFLVDGGSLLHPEPLQKLLERLPANFVRIHRSHAINLLHLRSFTKGQSSSVVLSDQSVAPVSRRKVPMLLAQLEG
jgi:DNA-binding LytR/AlgR family response regulator